MYLGKIVKGQKLLIILSLGYGATQGVAHQSKSVFELSKADHRLVYEGNGGSMSRSHSHEPAEIPVRTEGWCRNGKGVKRFLYQDRSGNRKVSFRGSIGT